MSKKTKKEFEKAVNRVYNELSNMSQSEFKKLLDDHKIGDIYYIIRDKMRTVSLDNMKIDNRKENKYKNEIKKLRKKAKKLGVVYIETFGDISKDEEIRGLEYCLDYIEKDLTTDAVSEETKKEINGNPLIRDKSGNYNSTDAFVTFVYLLGRDYLSLGKIQEALNISVNPNKRNIKFSNGWLAKYAEYVVNKLKE